MLNNQKIVKKSDDILELSSSPRMTVAESIAEQMSFSIKSLIESGIISNMDFNIDDFKKMFIKMFEEQTNIPQTKDGRIIIQDIMNICVKKHLKPKETLNKINIKVEE